jgi:cytochrome c-type biogenesis protein CcmI
MALLGALLLVTAVVAFVLTPILRGQHASLEREDDEMTDAEARRRVTLLALRDVEYDYHTGKLDETDYESMKRELSAEALAALKEAEAEADSPGSNQDALEAEIAALRQGLRSGTACTGCGHTNPSGSRFCASCGQPLASRRATTSP